jgi:long-chain acyl-CoA synthetase
MAVVERTAGTKTIANLWNRAQSRSGTAYLVERAEGQWEEVGWPDAARAVDEIANGLLALGIGKGDALSILGRTALEWALFDFALGSIGAIGAGIYPSLPPKDCAYVLDHSDSVAVLVEDEEQRAKVDAERAGLPKLQHVFAYGELEELRAKGRRHAADNPDALERARQAVGEDDLFTYIYTSGTTGPPKACMITHRNYYSMVGAVDDVPQFIGADDLILLYLPLAHNFGRCLHLLAGYVGCTVAFCPDPLRVGEVAPQVKPTVLPSVPRVFEKVHTAVQESFDEATGLKRRLIDWALRVGQRVSELKQHGKPVPAALAAQHRLADTLVYKKVKSKLGGRLRLPISGGAPLAKEIAEFFHTIDILICEGYGQTECTTASNVNMPTRFRFGTVGPAIPGIEVRTADDGEVLVRGPNLFRGYYKDEAATREVLDEDGWLHTGDIGRLPLHHRPQEGHHRHGRRQERLAAEPRERAQVLEVRVTGACDRRPAALPHRPDHPGRGRQRSQRPAQSRPRARGRGQPRQGVLRAGQALRDPAAGLLGRARRGHPHAEAQAQGLRGALLRRHRRPLRSVALEPTSVRGTRARPRGPCRVR